MVTKERSIDVYFLQISDTHHLRETHLPNDCFRESFRHLSTTKEKFLALSDMYQNKGITIDFICHCGDICHSGELEDYMDFRRVYEEVFGNLPLILCPGNHDKVSHVEEVFSWKDGKLWDFGELQLLSFQNANGERSNGEISGKTCEMLQDILGNNTLKATILVSHHHIFPQQSAMPPAKIDQGFYDILNREGICAYFNGHTHGVYVENCGNIPSYTVGSMCFSAKDVGNSLLKMTEMSSYHLFSYNNATLALEEQGELGFHKDLGYAQY